VNLTADAQRGGLEVKVHVVLQDTLDKLKSAAPKRLKELRDECDLGLEKLKASSATDSVNVDEFFKALKLACESSGSPKVVTIALDSIQKLINHGFLTGKGTDPFKEPAAGSHRCLMDSVIDCVCNCAENTDDQVQLQMIRALLTAVTSQTCEVHGDSLMSAVRTCFMIHKDSKNSMNQRTAQASLTQMLTVVTQRMELSSADMSRRSPSFDESSRQATKIASSDLALQSPAQLLDDFMTSYVTRLVDDVVIQKYGSLTPEQFVRSSGETNPPGKFGWCVICRQAAAHYCVDTKERYNAIDPVCSKNCKFRNLERIELVEAHFGNRHEEEHADPAHDICNGDTNSNIAESEASSSPPSSVAAHSLRAASIESTVFSTDSEGASDVKALNPHAQDALMVFKSLCRLSMKDLPTGQSDTRIVRSKRLSLELVLGMIQHCGPVFRSSVPFINEIKQLLCHSLIKNSVSSIPKIFVLSLRIFVMLITNFKDHLKAEIGVFIEQIFLRILESGNSTFYHKNHVLQVFYKLCTDASTALELFLNFDCDVDEKNVFERMMDCLSKIAQGRYTAVEHANLIQPDQEKELKMLSLQAMVTLMGSIVDWARRMAEDHKKLNIEDGDLGEQSQRADADSDGEDDATSNATFDTSSTITSSVPSSIVEQKQRKLELQIGVNKFNMKPKRGIEYLKQNGFVSDEPNAIAELFKNAEIGLDKTQIGDYLGEDKPLNKSVLYALVDSQDFKELELDMALRHFLSVFRLPGEAQKIDRMMEKFAEKYCQDNGGKFVNADCAFVLSFSLIMLQTDLHNPGIKNKMSKDDFVRNNRGINDNNDLPREYLESLYDSVLNHPISLKEDEDARTRLESQSAQGASQKYELFVRETESIVQKSQELMKQKGQKKNASYVAAHNVDHVRPLFEVACWPMLATLAVLLEMQDQPNSVDLCIEGFKHCIRIAARFDMDTERDAFVSSLAKFTYLTTLKEMKQKNIECIKALLSIGLNEGNDLGPSWQYVLHCISQLERLQLIGMKTRQDFQFFQGDDEAPQNAALQSISTASSTSGTQVLKRRAYGTGVSALMSIGQDDRQVELVNSESVLHQIDGAQIELLFNRSASLSSGAIVHFVTQLARVSKEELALPDQSRIFALQKLVEVADYNMNRMRVVWSRIWRVLSTHFVEVILHPNKSVSMYAVDSLRQLANKFLEKDELSNYNFQAEFLRPFEVVMTKQHDSINKDCKELIIHIIVQMVQKNRKNIKSGWKTVFHILHAAAQDVDGEYFAGYAFPVMQMVLEPETYYLFVENIVDGVRTLLAFGHCKADQKISLDAIKYLLHAAQYLADKDKPDPPLPPALLIAEAGQANSSHPAAHWFPILRGLSMLVADPRRDVRTAALNGVFDALREHGSAVFDEEAWRMVFNGVIKPLFDDIFHQLQGANNLLESQKPASQMGPPTCLLALTALVRVVISNLESLAFLLEDVLKLLKTCIQHETEAVARIGVEGFKQLLLGTAAAMKAESWTQVTDMVKQLFEGSMPEMLLKFTDADLSAFNGTLPFSKDDVVTQCVVQLLLIDMLQDAVAQHYDHVPPAGIMELLDALQRSFEFAQEFNQKLELRQALKQLGFMKEMKQLPGLLKQEREALSCSLKILFQVQSDARMLGTEFEPQALERLMMLCKNVLQNYASKERIVQDGAARSSSQEGTEGRDREAVTVEMEREVLGLVPIISEVVLRGLKDMDSKHTARFTAELFPLLCELTIVQSPEVREMVREILLEQIGPLLRTN